MKLSQSIFSKAIAYRKYCSIIALLTTLSLTQACSQSNEPVTNNIKGNANQSQVTEEKSIQSDKNNQSKNSSTIQNKGNEKNSTNAEQEIKNKTNKTNKTNPKPVNEIRIEKAKLNLPKKVKVNQTIPVKIDVKQSQNKSNKLTANDAQKVNLVLVSDDLRFFDFVNSSYKGDGKFQVNPKFPSPGMYSLFSTYEVSNREKQVFIEKIDIPGSVPLPTELETYSKTQKLGDTKVDLHLSQSKAGTPVTLKFNVKDSKNNKVVTDLQNYLGDKAQLVIIKSSYPLNKSDFIPNQVIQKSSDNKLSFSTKFPYQGTYKMWLKFNRAGKIKTADFWVKIS